VIVATAPENLGQAFNVAWVQYLAVAGEPTGVATAGLNSRAWNQETELRAESRFSGIKSEILNPESWNQERSDSDQRYAVSGKYITSS
jgi:hypothetical protein